jgi:uncharacterized protein
MTSPFLNKIAEALATCGVETTKFEFDYMAARRNGGKDNETKGGNRPPPPMARLCKEYLAVIESLPAADPPHFYIGGKSMGGRVASLVAEELYCSGKIAGLVCLGYPFHPPRKPETLRVAHLADLTCPTLIVQGTRDPLGTRAEVETYSLSAAISLVWLDDGDHDFKPRRASGHTQDRHIAAAAHAIANFMGE